MTPAAFSRTLSLERNSLKLPRRLNAESALKLLIDANSLKEFRLVSEKYGTEERIGIPECDIFDIALSMKTLAYFSHGTAAFLNHLTDDVPTTVYLNREQSPKKPPSGGLTQVGIDRAFSSKGRRSSYTFKVFNAARVRQPRAPFGEVDSFKKENVGDALGEVTLLSGKHTDGLEVGTALTPRGRAVPTTKLERTLIDIAVRPDYAGGPTKVADVYERAVLRGISTGALLATLKALDYKYPYHQVIGFYLERAGAGPSVLDRLMAMKSDFRFYLNYSMKGAVLNDRWNVYVPEGM